MRYYILAIVAMALLPLHAFAQDRSSDYNFYKSKAIPADSKAPLLLVFHGGLGNKDFLHKRLGMDALAEKNKFMVAYMNGTEGDMAIMKNRRTWNAGECCGVAARKNIDDVAYIDSVIDRLIQTQNADPSRIYLMGHSNGAMMSFRYACERHERIAAAVTVSGPLSLKECPDASGVSILHIHGMKDDHVPVQGGRGEKALVQGYVFRSVEETKLALIAAGAQFQTVLLPETGHHYSDVNGGLLKTSGKSLAQTIWDFVKDKKKGL